MTIERSQRALGDILFTSDDVLEVSVAGDGVLEVP